MLGGGSASEAARETGARIERLLEEFRSAARPEVADRAEELVALLVELYGAGLRRIVALLGEGPGGEAVLRRLATDDLVASLLVLHDLHPDDTGTRVLAALDRVRPYLGSHAGGVEYLGIADDEHGDEHGPVVRLRLRGSCPSSLVTVKAAIEQAIEQAAPEVVRVEVEGVRAARRGRDNVQFLDLAPPPPRLDRSGTAS
jgi:Fe-S cluster biogenesis protein NfuA